MESISSTSLFLFLISIFNLHLEAPNLPQNKSKNPGHCSRFSLDCTSKKDNSLRPIPTGFKTEGGEWSDEAKERFFGAKNEEATVGATFFGSFGLGVVFFFNPQIQRGVVVLYL